MTFKCNICLDHDSQGSCWRECLDLFPDSTTSSDGVCSKCIKNYLMSEIDSNAITGDGSIRCLCSSSTCTVIFSRIEILQNDLPADCLDKYTRFAADAAIEKDPSKLWCPRSGCYGVADKISSRRALCGKCRLNFCAKCGADHMTLLDCSMVVSRDFQEWKGNTMEGCRRCPSCRRYIEKNGGCRHMTCVHCHHEFCWRCKQKWSKCRGGTLCRGRGLLKHHVWGTNSLERTFTKTVVLPVGVGVGCAAVAVAAGAAVVCIVSIVPVKAVKAVLRRVEERRQNLEMAAPRELEFHVEQCMTRTVNDICAFDASDDVSVVSEFEFFMPRSRERLRDVDNDYSPADIKLRDIEPTMMAEDRPFACELLDNVPVI